MPFARPGSPENGPFPPTKPTEPGLLRFCTLAHKGEKQLGILGLYPATGIPKNPTHNADTTGGQLAKGDEATTHEREPEGGDTPQSTFRYPNYRGDPTDPTSPRKRTASQPKTTQYSNTPPTQTTKKTTLTPSFWTGPQGTMAGPENLRYQPKEPTAPTTRNGEHNQSIQGRNPRGNSRAEKRDTRPRQHGSTTALSIR